MLHVYHALSRLQGHTNPLIIIAKNLRQQARVICFDEFFVDNVADAMLLSSLLKIIFKNGVCFIATSNLHPEALYKDGLQREQFLPAIELIKQHTHIFQLTFPYDYHFTYLDQTEVYFTPSTPIRKQAGDTIWFEFMDFCGILSISNVAVIRPKQKNLITSFIKLIDIFYDAKYVFSFWLQPPLKNFIQQGPFVSSSLVPQSRLIEM